ncbi:MAG: hypothetical protein JJE35_00720 [Thermoleophilia bacterium]|nr:hypothetical protein [Thermoleophilia bacterium]
MLGPFWAGFLGGLGSLAGIFLGILAMSAAFSGEPSDDLFRDLLAVDIALLIAYSVATAGVSIGVQRLDSHLSWLGSICSVGLGGGISIGLGVALAAYVEAGHSGDLVRIGLYWIIGTSALLGVFIAFLPYAAFSWKKTARED